MDPLSVYHLMGGFLVFIIEYCCFEWTFPQLLSSEILFLKAICTLLSELNKKRNA
jgi:hypothetical protein